MVHLASGTHRSCCALNFLLTSVRFQKQLTQYTKVVNHVLEITSKAREEWESEAGARATQVQTYSTADTHTLLAAVYAGKGLKVNYCKRNEI